MYGLIRRSSFRDSVSALGQAVLDSRFLETDIMVRADVRTSPGPTITQVGLWDILYFPLLGLVGPYLRIFFRGFKWLT